MKIDLFSNTIEVDFAFKITELFLEMEKKLGVSHLTQFFDWKTSTAKIMCV